jgi:hypothetical protein
MKDGRNDQSDNAAIMIEAKALAIPISKPRTLAVMIIYVRSMDGP